MADSVLATVRSIISWYETRTENYDSPIKKGMNRDKREAHEKARSRILSDQEIRDVWAAASDGTAFGAIVKLLLLTGQRREKVATMKWSDIKDGTWTISTENREKGNAGSLRLPPIAVEIIASQSQVDNNPYVFPGDARRRRKTADRSRPACFSAWAQRKAQLDARLPADMPGWVIHDLRRTARSLMSRAGVGNDIAERVLGHRIAGVQGIYNRHDYEDEKADALRRLAALIDKIVHPPADTNIVNFPAGAVVKVGG